MVSRTSVAAATGLAIFALTVLGATSASAATEGWSDEATLEGAYLLKLASGEPWSYL